MKGATQLPQNWVRTKVGDVCQDLQYGYTESASDEACGPRFLRITDIQDGSVNWPSVPYCSIRPELIEKYALRHGDIVFARTGGTVGKSFLISNVPEPAVFASYLIRLSPHPEVVPSYLYFFFQSLAYWEQIGLKKGGLQGNVNATTLSSLELPLCSRNEQLRIVAKIEKLFSEIDKGVESLTTAREQLSAYRHAVLKRAFEGTLTRDWRTQNSGKHEKREALLSLIQEARDARNREAINAWEQAIKHWSSRGERGKKPPRPSPPAKLTPVDPKAQVDLPDLPSEWSYVRLDTIAQIGSGMSVSKDRQVEDPINVPYLRVANVQRGRLDLSHITSMNIERGQLFALMLKKWDVLFNEGGDRNKLGRGWIWEEQISPCITQNHVFRASPYIPTETNAKFISYWGNTYGQSYFDVGGKQTTNLASINKSVLSAFPVPLIPIQEQAELVQQVESQLSLTDALESDVSVALNSLDALKQAILKKAFSGQLVPHDLHDEPAAALLGRIRADMQGADSGRNKKNGKKEAA